MSLTVGEVKENADYNLRTGAIGFQIEMGKQQQINYDIAIELGADEDDDWDDWSDKVEEHKNK
jgi:hypothetical protein